MPPVINRRISMEFINSNSLKFLNWPPQSPNVNPIENLWHIVKVRRQAKYGMPLDKADLIDQVFDIWESIEDKLVETLCDSVSRRLYAVIDAGGKHCEEANYW